MKYDYRDKRVIINNEKEKDIFFKTFFKAVERVSEGAKVYYESISDATMETIANDCALVIMTDKDGYVYCAEVWCEDGVYYGRAEMALYDCDNFTRNEVAEIARHIRDYWIMDEEEIADIILYLAMKEPLTAEWTRMLAGSIYQNSLNVESDGHICPNFLPRMIDVLFDEIKKGDCFAVSFEIDFP